MNTTAQRLDHALATYRSLVDVPRTPAALCQRGVDLMRQGFYSDAAAWFEQAIAAAPQDAMAHYCRGGNLIELGQFDAALDALEQARALGLDNADVAHNRGIALLRLGRAEEALASLTRALQWPNEPNRAFMLNTEGYVLQHLARHDDALLSFENALALAPGLEIARLNHGIACLTLGRWLEGWEGYEWRWSGAREAMQGVFKPYASGLPQWQGEAVETDAGLLVFTEQGFGDALQFVRYVALARQRFARVTLGCPPQLKRLFGASLPADIELIDVVPEDQSAWQWQCSLLSLPRAFGTTLATVPAEVPYLRAPPDLAAGWRKRLDLMAARQYAAGARPRLKVGFVWAGAAGLLADAQRSIPVERLLPLMTMAHVHPVSLQKIDAGARGAAMHAGLTKAMAAGLLDWTWELGDFADTAALIDSLDLVIAVDTAVAHLAAALGKPVWLLNRFSSEWRWMHGREDSPWYPTLRLFNQTRAGHWDDVLERLRSALAQPDAILTQP